MVQTVHPFPSALKSAACVLVISAAR